MDTSKRKHGVAVPCRYRSAISSVSETLKREESVYHKPQDPFRIVTGPVSISFIGRAVKLWAYFDQNTVIGLGG
jgi:hypothetical protein